MKVAVALNRTSSKGRSAKQFDVIRDTLAEYPVEPVWVCGQSAAEDRATMRELAESGEIAALLCAGGDGMVHSGVNALGDTHIPLGIVAIGTGNDIARQFGLPRGKAAAAVRQALDALMAQRTKTVDLIEIEGAEVRERALAVVSCGIDADINLRSNHMTWPRGGLRYIRALIHSLLAYKPYGAQVTIAGETNRGMVSVLSVANTQYIGSGIHIAPQADPADGYLDLVLVGKIGGKEIAEMLPKLAVSKHISDPRVHTRRVTEIHIAPDLASGIQLPKLMADGEEIVAAPATVRILPQALELLV
ncbi:MAG: diacylglycerol kinase family lipid kinase [Trueperella sp.]|nr:diacylglycerol kinase family lipid kinase [Trueperella sp.]